MEVHTQPEESVKYLFDINIKNLIIAVEKRRALYDTSISGYRDRARKKKLWDEVYKEVCMPEMWNSMSKKTKIDYGLEVQKKWSSLRNCFRREIITQHQYNAGLLKHKKRKYFYYDSLLFLLPFTEKLPSLNSIKNTQNETAEDKTNEDQMDNESDSFDSDSNSTPSNEVPTINIEDIKKESTVIDHEEQASSSTRIEEVIINRKRNIEIESFFVDDEVNRSVLQKEVGNDDGDEAFLQSLLPTIREFTSEQKLLLRIEILKTILNFKQSYK